MKAIWIDPGETVGWATFDISTPIISGPKYKPATISVLNYDNTRLRPFAEKLLQSASDYDTIGFETYQIRPDKLREHAGSTVPTLQLVGMIRLAAWAAQSANGNGFPLIEEQSPNDKSFGLGAMRLHFSDDIQNVIADALAGKHDDGHYGDALLHGVAWFHRRFIGTPGMDRAH